MSKGVNLFTTLITSLIISLVVSAGMLYVAIPIVYPSNVDSSSLRINQITSIEDNTEQGINDNDIVFQKMNETKIIISIGNQSSILAQFAGDFATVVYFGTRWTFEIALVIQGVGNQTTSIEQTGVDSLNQYNTHNIMINYLTPSLPAGDYTVEVYWRSTFSHPSRSAYLRTYYFDQDLVYRNTTRTLTLWEIANGI